MPTISRLPRPAGGYAFHGIVYQRARQAMHGGLRIIFADGEQMPILLLDLMPAGNEVSSLPLGPCTATVLPSIFTVTPLGSGIGFFPIRDIKNQPLALGF